MSSMRGESGLLGLLGSACTSSASSPSSIFTRFNGLIGTGTFAIGVEKLEVGQRAMISASSSSWSVNDRGMRRGRECQLQVLAPYIEK